MRASTITASIAIVLVGILAFATTLPAQQAAAFPQGARIAYVDFERIAQDTAAGKASAQRINALIQKKQTEGADMAKKLQADKERLYQAGSQMSAAAREQLLRDVGQQVIDEQRFQTAAQAEINELQNSLNDDFQRKLLPVLKQVAQERGLQILLSRADAGIIWCDPALDLSADVVRKLGEPSTPEGARKQ